MTSQLLVGLGVVIDMAGYMSEDVMAAGANFGEAEIQAAAKAQGNTLGKGDIVLFHTDWTEGMLESEPTT